MMTVNKCLMCGVNEFLVSMVNKCMMSMVCSVRDVDGK